jgi:hypothetical protein
MIPAQRLYLLLLLGVAIAIVVAIIFNPQPVFSLPFYSIPSFWASPSGMD